MTANLGEITLLYEAFQAQEQFYVKMKAEEAKFMNLSD